MSERMENAPYVMQLPAAHGTQTILWASAAEAERVFQTARIAMLELGLPLFLHGESGTGKSLVARAIHSQLNGGKEQPFMALNCSGIPATLAESELFGHEKGAFTGATSIHEGKFEAVGEGTLFLDEIGDMDPSTQAKLLQPLQEKTIVRVGGNTNIPIAARIIAATHQDLRQLVEERRFRTDLLYRIDRARIDLPPLRERSLSFREELVRILLRRMSPIATLEDTAMTNIVSRRLKGNFRELETIVSNAYIGSQLDGDGSNVIREDHLQRFHEERPPEMTEGIKVEYNGHVALVCEKDGMPFISLPMETGGRDRETLFIMAAVTLTGGNVERAGKKYGFDRRKVYGLYGKTDGVFLRNWLEGIRKRNNPNDAVNNG